MTDGKMFMFRTRYRHLLALSILNMRELDELGTLMERLDPERFNREVAASEAEHG
jgi:hypothetical protein